MNRRELFQSVTSIAAASGVIVQGSTVDADVTPALAIIECDRPLAHEIRLRLLEQWENVTVGTSFAGVKLVVLSDGLKLTLLDVHGRPLNRRLEDEP